MSERPPSLWVSISAQHAMRQMGGNQDAQSLRSAGGFGSLPDCVQCRFSLGFSVSDSETLGHNSESDCKSANVFEWNKKKTERSPKGSGLFVYRDQGKQDHEKRPDRPDPFLSFRPWRHRATLPIPPVAGPVAARTAIHAR